MSYHSKLTATAAANSFTLDQLSVERTKRRFLRDALKQNEQRDYAFRRMILSIPPGKVSTLTERLLQLRVTLATIAPSPDFYAPILWIDYLGNG